MFITETTKQQIEGLILPFKIKITVRQGEGFIPRSGIQASYPPIYSLSSH